MSAPDAPSDFLTLDIKSPDGRLRGNLAVPQGEMRLAELAFNVLPLGEKLVAMAERRHLKTGPAVSCAKGCGACCRQLVPLSPPEAWMLADLVAGLPEARRARVVERFSAIRDHLDATGWRRSFDQRATLDEAALFQLGVTYFSFGMPCPFLEDEACSIHPVRPSICREYLVTSPAERCAHLGVGEPIARVPVAVRLSESLCRLTSRLLGREQPLIPLTLALEWAEAHRDEGAQRWPARQLLEGLLAELSGQTS